MKRTPNMDSAYRRWLLLTLCFTWSSQLMAQFPTSPTTTGRPPADAGDLFGGQATFNTDSLGLDSTNVQLDIDPDTRYIDKDAFWGHRDYLVPVGNTLEQSLYFDVLEPVGGFVQSLGQTGKPYQVFRNGFRESYFDLALDRDVFFNRYDRYSLSAGEQVMYYDSKTPYIDIHFHQGQRSLQVVDVTISRSLGPSLNLTGRLRRPQSVGAYRNFATDHNLAYFSTHYQSKKQKYHAFLNATLNRQSDQINGGVPRDADSELYPINDGLITDNLSAYNLTFFKENFSPLLDAQVIRRKTTVYLDHFYHLFGQSDTIEKKHRLTFRNTISYDWQSRKFSDATIDTNSVFGNLIPVLPTLADTTNSILDTFSVRRLNIVGAASYSWILGSGWQANANGGISYQRIAVNGDSASLNQNITEQFGNVRLSFPGGYLTGDIRQRASTQFQTEQKINAAIVLGLFGGKDSLAVPGQINGPVRFNGNVMIGNLNPSLFQARWQTGTGTDFRGNDSLRNEQLLHARANLSWTPKAVIREGDTLLPNYASVGAFWSNRQNPILYTQNFEPIQATDAITRLGIEGSFRLRFWKHFHFETTATYNPRLTTSEDETVDLYLRSVPVVHGNSKIYFDHRDLDIAREFRLGLGMNYWTSYAGQTLEPVSGEFYPTNYEVLPFTAGEAFFQLNIHGVFVYFRYLYLNENLLFNGYYSTPFYPMMERSYLLGINWTFYD